MYYITEEKTAMRPERVWRLLKDTYWAKNRSLETVRRSMENSVCFGGFRESDGEQVSFCRVVTDYATAFYLCDVVVDPECRGQGLGKRMVKQVVEDPRFRDLRGILLTHDAHGLYSQFGFEVIENRYMGFNAV